MKALSNNQETPTIPVSASTFGKLKALEVDTVERYEAVCKTQCVAYGFTVVSC